MLGRLPAADTCFPKARPPAASATTAAIATAGISSPRSAKFCSNSTIRPVTSAKVRRSFLAAYHSISRYPTMSTVAHRPTSAPHSAIHCTTEILGVRMDRGPIFIDER